MAAPHERDGASSPRVRPVSADDLRSLEPLDGAYAARLGLEPYVTLGSLHFFGRTGHSFVTEAGGNALGFALAHSTWSGGDPVLRLERLVGTAEAANALAAAVVKSAYDAGVYRLVADVPEGDATGRAAVEAAGFAQSPTVSYARRLGSAGKAA